MGHAQCVRRGHECARVPQPWQSAPWPLTRCLRRVRAASAVRAVEKAVDAEGVERPAAPVSEAFTRGHEAAARRSIFNNIAPVYDELNDRLSFGQQRVWKAATVKWSGAHVGERVLDVCCGTGDLARLLARAVGPEGQVVALDFARDMLDGAQQRVSSLDAWSQCKCATIRWVQGDALDLPFGDGEFAAATMGYGLRNVADRPRALRELCRVLAPGGRAAVLDFNNSTNEVVDSVQALFLEQLVVPAARQYGLEQEYAYLRPSIKGFPTGRELEQMALASGFSAANHYELSFGLMGVLVAVKQSSAAV